MASNDDERRRLLDQGNGSNPWYNTATMPTPHYHHPQQIPGYGGVMAMTQPQNPVQNPALLEPQMSEAHKSQPAGMASMVPGQQMLTKSYSVHAEGAL
eukprot:scaffold10206_cov74-Skeletonema_marinoi.AAC.1